MKHPQDMTTEELFKLQVVDDSRQISENLPAICGAVCHGGKFSDVDGDVWGTFLLRSGWIRYPASLSVLG